MEPARCNILSIVPYRFLPPVSGGHLSIACLHHYLGKLCGNHIVSTKNNDAGHRFAFRLHAILPDGKGRYIPYTKYAEIAAIAKQNSITHICCEHPYMALTTISLAKNLGVPWYLRSQNIEAARFKTLKKIWWPLMFRFEKYAMNKANGVLFITQEDQELAISHYGLKESNCHVVPFGTILERPPTGHDESKMKLSSDLQIDEKVPFLYFLGLLDYYPNVQAVSFILTEVMPRLNKKGLRYEVVIAGKGLPGELKQKIENTAHIQYTGFVSNLENFLLGCDVMLNPVQLGGGIKTKAVEALAHNKVVVSTRSGAAGLIPEACGNNLLITDDNNWDAFTDNVITAIQNKPQIPQAFYDMYYWGNIAAKMHQIICG